MENFINNLETSKQIKYSEDENYTYRQSLIVFNHHLLRPSTVFKYIPIDNDKDIEHIGVVVQNYGTSLKYRMVESDKVYVLDAFNCGKSYRLKLVK